MTTTFEIHNSAGPAGDRLRGSIEEALATAAPLVERTAQMALPAQLTVRLVTVGEVRADATQRLARLYRQAVDKLSLDPAHPVVVKTIARGTTRPARLFGPLWPLELGRTVLEKDGPQLIVMPAAHAGAGTTTRQQTAVMAHELVHAAQLNIWPGMADFDARATLRMAFKRLPERRTVPAAAPVFEGHAQAVHREIVAEMTGKRYRRLLPGEARPGLRYRTAQALTLVPPYSLIRLPYDLGERFVTAVMQAGGTPLVRTLFREDEDRLPLTDELLKPHLWIARYAAEPSAGPAGQQP